MAHNVLTNVNINGNEVQNIVLQPLAADPENPKQGQIYYNTTTNRVRQYTSSEWKDVGGGVQSISLKTDETVLAVDNTDPENPKLGFRISSGQGEGVEVSEEADGLAIVIQGASTSQFGVTKLDSTPSATEETKAATPKGANVTIEKLSTATEGYFATYEVKQGGVSAGKIDIPKDFLVKAVSVEVCTEDDKPVAGLKVGDKYIDFVINVKSGTATDEHLYIPCKDLGAFISTDQAVIAVGSTTASVTLPAGSEYVSSECFVADEKVLVDTKIEAATSSSAGSVTFTIASAYTSAITCNVAYLK